MIRSKVATMAVVAGLMLAAVSVSATQAAQPSQSTHTVFSTICDGTGFEVRETGPMSHTRDYWYAGNYHFLVEGQWVQSGTYRYDVDQSTWGPQGGTGSGTFAIRDSMVGDYDGHWAWNYGKGDDGHGVGMSDGDHVKVTFLASDPVDLPVPPDDGCFGAGYLVISTY